MADQKRNPRNPASFLFRKLTRIFSGPMVNYRRQTERAIKKKYYKKYQNTFKSTSGQEFRRDRYDPFENINSHVMVTHQKAQRYSDFQSMEFSPEISSVLDIYADEMTTSTKLQPLLNIDCPNEEIKDVLKVLYHDILNIDFNLFGWSRSMCKYGDFYMYLDIDEEDGVKHVIGLPTDEVEREEGQDPDNPNYVQFVWGAAGMTFENWQMAHFRILGDDKHAPYGTSVLDGARRIWRQLELVENAMMAYRIVRSPERKVFYVDVGNIAPQDVEQFIQRFITQMKRNQVVDSSTGRVDLRYNPLSTEEDYYIPIRGGVGGTRIEALPGGSYTGDIDDVKYLRDKLFSALKVPMAYLSRGEGADEDKTTLCLRLDTKIPLLDGRVLSLEEIIENFNNNLEKEMYSYSFDTIRNRIIPGKIKWAGITKKNADDIIRIWFDNGEFLDCTENHEILTKDNNKKLAKDLKEGESLIPFYRDKNKRGYETIYQFDKEEFQLTHKMVALESRIYNQGKVIHHKDYNKYNNNPKNLDCSMTWLEHRRFHSKNIETTLMREDVVEQRKKDYKDPESNWNKWIHSDRHREISSVHMKKQATDPKQSLYKWIHSKEHSDSMSEIMKNRWKDEKYRQLKTRQNKELWQNDEVRNKLSGENHWRVRKNKEYDFEWLVNFCKQNNIFEKKQFLNFRKRPVGERHLYKILKVNGVNTWREFRKLYLTYNHKIVKIEKLNIIEDVGCLTIDNEFHNFAIESGIFVGNSQKDIRFSRTIQRLQRAIIAELEKIGRIHLYIKGYRDADLISFELSLNNPSKIAELQELEHWRTKFEVASSATEGYFSKRWIAKNIFGLSDEEHLRNIREMYFDAQLDSELESVSEGGGLGGIGEEVGGELFGDEEGEETSSEGDNEEDETLLAAPAKRDELYLTPGAKGKEYKRVNTDKRNMGARKRSYRGKYADEVGRNTMRNLFKGLPDMKTLSSGIFESKKYIDIDEDQIIKVNEELKEMVKQISEEKKKKEEVKDKIILKLREKSDDEQA